MLTDREVLDSLSTGVLVAGSDEVTCHANPAACRMLGKDVGACIDQPVPLLLGMSASLRDHGLDEIDAERRLAIRLPIGPAGATLRNVRGCGFVCLFRLSDEGRGADRRLQDAERESAVTAMLAAFAHEVRNPLAAITAAADMLRADLPPDGPGEGHLAIIERQIRRLAGLAYTPFALGLPTTTQRVQCKVDQLVTDALAMVAADAAGRHLQLRIELARDLPRVIVGERELVDALAALLENAIAASPIGAVVEVTACADYDVASARSRVLIEISDRGAGMAPSEIAEALRAFHPTRLASNASGLALAHRHILDSGGRLSIDGAPGHGVSAKVELTAEEPR